MADQELLKKPILGKIILEATLKCETGLHIGASKELLDIGGIDLPVVRDPITKRPYIPGSSVKGKLRSLLERVENKEFNRNGATFNNPIMRHECAESDCVVCRLFGAIADRQNRSNQKNLPSRILVRDLPLTQEGFDLLKDLDTGLLYTEWKFENNLDRVTAAANPRQLERVPAGSLFGFSLVYTVETERDEAKADLNNLLMMMEMLEDDALGGHGSRGYGRVTFGAPVARSKSKSHYLNYERGEAPRFVANAIAELRGKLPDIIDSIYNVASA